MLSFLILLMERCFQVVVYKTMQRLITARDFWFLEFQPELLSSIANASTTVLYSIDNILFPRVYYLWLESFSGHIYIQHWVFPGGSTMP